MIGQVLAGRYELQDLAGTGGMSSVYRARDTVLERTVAIKILHEHFSDDPEYVERFRREARALAQLNHPNIVTVIDRGEFEGRQFIVFEHLDGETLKSLVEREGPLAVDRALALVHQIARGLAFAHEHGVVHRDVKPHNVLIDDDGVAKVTDFGIARSLEPADGLTETGTLLGTSEYIAPEQASGNRVDERSDQYSLAVVLYELLTGEPPYSGENFMAVAMKHIREPVPSVRQSRPDVSPRLDAIVARAMAKRPEDRFPSTEALMAALEAARSETGVREASADDDTASIEGPAPPPPPPLVERRRRAGRFPLPLLLGLLVIGVAALVLALVIAGGGTDALTGDDGQGGAGGESRVGLTALSDYDPDGDSTEHPDDVPAATDGDPTTSWTTETYQSFTKAGVGIVLDAGSEVELSELVVTTDTPGFQAEIQASNEPDGGFEKISGTETVEGETAFELRGGGSNRYYLVWITDPNTRAHVSEVTAQSLG
ncbi:MAG TPA: protein kinase [Gaiellaceae bacterium]|nr:protein kinase [Gaiellaceae bacterium]